MQRGLVYSNRVEQLYLSLREQLFSLDSSLFSQRLIVVPSEAMRLWLQQKLAMDPDIGICAGVEILFLDQAIEKLVERDHRPPSGLTLSLRLALEIESVHQEGAGPEWDAVWRYLIPGDGALTSRRSQRRLLLLCDTLATLFRQYGQFAPQMVAEWNEGWQAELWKRLFPQGSPWNSTVLPRPSSQLSLHLFTMSFLPPHIAQLLAESRFPLFLYHLSPCAAFWSDIRSDRESRRLKRFMAAEGATTDAVEELDLFLRDRNSLLANFGRMGRQMVETLDFFGEGAVESYQISSALSQEYEEWLDPSVIEEVEEDASLLSRVQADLLTMRNIRDEEPRAIPPEDDSIEFHLVPSIRREVEILYDNLVRLLDENRLTSGDVIVMAPDIMAYKASIEVVFGREGSQLDYQVMDVLPEEHNSLLQGVNLLLALVESRWNLSALFSLFDHSTFRRALQVEEGEVARWREWVEEAGIHWGLSRSHRNQLLRRNYCEKEAVEKGEFGTWEEGFRFLMDGLVTGDGGLPLSEAATLTRLVSIVKSLYSDLAPFATEEVRPVGEWLGLLSEVVDRYLAGEQSEWEWLQGQFRACREAAEEVGESGYSFVAVESLLRKRFTEQKVVLRESSVNVVRFCSMLPLRAIPSPILALLGMEEGAFPGVNRLQSLDEMVGDERADYCPSRTDYDRYLFLEALLSVRSHLLISYRETLHGEPLGPSLLVSELIHYLDSGYHRDGEKVTEAAIHRHPFAGYDSSYFKGDSRSSSLAVNYALACAERDSSDPLQKANWFSARVEREQKLSKEISLQDLERFARNPFKAFLNRTLGLFPKEEKHEEEEAFSLSPLKRASLLREGYSEGAERVERSTALPSGLFRDIALEELHEGVEGWNRQLNRMGLQKEEAQTVIFSRSVQQREQIGERSWVVPALQIGEVCLTGTIEGATEEGLLLFRRESLSEICKAWPKLLAMLACEQWPFTRKRLLFVPSGTSKEPGGWQAADLLSAYIDAVERNQREPLPWLPEWIAPLLADKPLPQDLKSTFQGDYRTVYSPELEWAYRMEGTLESKELITPWKEELFSLFAPLVEEWT